MDRNKILGKANILIQEGNRLDSLACSNIDKKNYSYYPYFKIEQNSELFLWRNEVDFLIKNNLTFEHYFTTTLKEINKTDNKVHTDLYRNFQERFALLSSFKSAIENNELDSWQYEVSAEDFSSFLDHAKDFHKQGNKEIAAVIAGSVLEDTIKKIAQKHGINIENKTMSPLIIDLQTAHVFNKSKSKSLESLALMRNAFSHMNEDEMKKYDIKDIGRMINDIETLISDYLYPKP